MKCSRSFAAVCECGGVERNFEGTKDVGIGCGQEELVQTTYHKKIGKWKNVDDHKQKLWREMLGNACGHYSVDLFVETDNYKG
jgi:hypothetical protein